MKNTNNIEIKNLINKYRTSNLKNYIRLKTLVYYYPDIFADIPIQDIELALSCPSDANLILNRGDFRCKALDEIFHENNKLQQEYVYGQNYVSLLDFFKHFHI